MQRACLWMVLLPLACGGEPSAGTASLSGAVNRTFHFDQVARLWCCPPGAVACTAPCGFEFSLSEPGIQIGILLPALSGDAVLSARSFTEAETAGGLQCYAGSSTPGGQNAVWDVEFPGYGSVSLTFSSLNEVPNDGYTAHGHLHASCLPSNYVGPGNAAKGTVVLDLWF